MEALRAGSPSSPRGEAFLFASARAWLATAVLGQLAFAAYVAAFYGRTAAEGNWLAWNKVLPKGYVAGDLWGNAAVSAHLILALVVILGGPLQLMPTLRIRYPAFHRWVGRAFVAAACLTSLAGLAMVWIRGGAVGDLPQHLGITLDALFILAFSVQVVRTARTRAFEAHRRWALRLYLVVNAVWFFRITLMAWLLIHRGPAGFDPKTFTGPFLTFLAFAQTLVPLAVLELYFWARRTPTPTGQWGVGAGLSGLTLFTALGVFGAIAGMWLPRL